LTHEKNAFLIEPKRVDEIVLSIKKIIENKPLRKHLIANAIELAKENTLEVKTKNMISIIKEYGVTTN
jgi:glycosyltransferase involved in cell wall biosynthesis